MASSDEKHSNWPLIAGIILVVLALTAGPAFAALTFSGTSISGDAGVTISGNLLDENGNQYSTSTPQWINLMAVGAKCDGVTDDTAALNTALGDAYNQGGGTVVIPVAKICRITGQITLPNDGQTVPSQKPIRITSFGNPSKASDPSGIISPNGAGALDLEFNSPIGKIYTVGTGYLEIDHLILEDTASDCAPFIFTAETVLDIHDDELYSGPRNSDQAIS